jgi:hypothetical protein
MSETQAEPLGDLKIHKSVSLPARAQDLVNKIELVTRSTNTTFSLNNEEPKSVESRSEKEYLNNLSKQTSQRSSNEHRRSVSCAPITELHKQEYEDVEDTQQSPLNHCTNSIKYGKALLNRDNSIDKIDMSISNIHNGNDNELQTEESIDNPLLKSTAIADMLKDRDLNFNFMTTMKSDRLVLTDRGPMSSRDLSTENILNAVTMENLRNNSTVRKDGEKNSNEKKSLPVVLENSQERKCYALPVRADDKENMGNRANRYVAQQQQVSQFNSNDTANSSIMEKEITKLRVPEDLSTNRARINKSTNPFTMLTPIDPANGSIKIPKIRFDMRKVDSDSDEDEIHKVEMKYLKRR